MSILTSRIRGIAARHSLGAATGKPAPAPRAPTHWRRAVSCKKNNARVQSGKIAAYVLALLPPT